ncbi:SufE family protein [Pararhizobium sp. IMCC21322]|uniref:SufE family protein n=1 Tax=Pararhizobium sp. IMCC21322 TaxID=3067903 RepID=UPI002742760C|nr:SufE family protein [Pararhizobium sp. IMCC21322]
MNITDIIENFSYLDDWEDRYKYVIELGKELETMPDALQVDANKVRGCTSQVWLSTRVTERDGEPVLHFLGNSDAHIVRGLVCITLAIFNDKTAREIVDLDAEAIFNEVQLRDHISAQRSNGLNSMLQRIRADAHNLL